MVTSRKVGRMCFNRFIELNKAHLAKQAWRAISNRDTLWLKTLKALYFKDCTFGDARKKGNSRIQNTVLVRRDIICRNGRWEIGLGGNININSDQWLANGLLAQRFGIKEFENVSELIDPRNCFWDTQKLGRALSSTSVIFVVQTPLASLIQLIHRVGLKSHQ